MSAASPVGLTRSALTSSRGSRDDIIEGFYERCLADQPAALRAFVEDRLLSDSGYRESITLDSVRRALGDKGVPAAPLEELVRRRLLRIEERLDVARVEIIHDVLTSVIRKSRDTRHLRQAETTAAERKAASQYERYRREQLRRARCLAATMTLLVVITIGVAWWGWSSKVEAERQSAAAEEQRSIAERQRAAAEEFSAIAQKQRAAATAYRTSLDALLNLVEKDPSNVQLQRSLSVNYNKVGDVLRDQGDPAAALAEYRAALDIARRLAGKDPGDAQWQRDLSVSHDKVGEVLSDQGNLAAALAEYRAALDIARRLAGKNPGDVQWQRSLSVSHDKVGDLLRDQGDPAAALTEYQAALDIGQRFAEADPGDAQWQRGLLLTYEKIGLVASQRKDFPDALSAFEEAEKIALRLKEINPAAASSAQDLDRVRAQVEETHRRIAESTPVDNHKK